MVYLVILAMFPSSHSQAHNKVLIFWLWGQILCFYFPTVEIYFGNNNLSNWKLYIYGRTIPHK